MREMTFIFFILVWSFALKAQVLTNEVKNFFQEVEGLGEISPSCSDKIEHGVPSIEKLHKTIPIEIKELRKENYEGLELSVLSLSDAKKMYQIMRQLDYIPQKYLDDGCYSRAHELTLLAKENGIELGKAFMLPKEEHKRLYPYISTKQKRVSLPKEFVGWKYHTAAFVLVEEAGKVNPYVLDIGVSNDIQDFETWKKSLSRNNDDVDIKTRERGHIFHDTNFKNETRSTLKSLKEREDLIDEIGYGEYIFRLESGWL